MDTKEYKLYEPPPEKKRKELRPFCTCGYCPLRETDVPRLIPDFLLFAPRDRK
jgi:hypothetical protein